MGKPTKSKQTTLSVILESKKSIETKLLISLDTESRAALLKEYTTPTPAKRQIEEYAERLQGEWNNLQSQINENVKAIIDQQGKTALLKEYDEKRLELSNKLSINDKEGKDVNLILKELQSVDKLRSKIYNDAHNSLPNEYNERSLMISSQMSANTQEAIQWEILNLKCLLSDSIKLSTQEVYKVVNENKDYPELLKYLLQKKNKFNQYKLKQATRLIGRETKIEFDIEDIEKYEEVLTEQISYVREMLHLSRNENSSIENLEETKQPQPSKHLAFTYSKTGASAKNNLTEFRKDLIAAGFIDKGTSLANFNKVFKNELPVNPIKWTGNLSELYYLIKLLHNDKKLINSTGKEVWKITANCFVDADGNNYDYQKFRGQKNPASKIKLDTIVSHL